MRTVHWLFVVSVALFVSGIGFVIAGGRTARTAPAAAAAPATMTPVATVRQIMNGIVGPSATTIFDAVVTTISFQGIDDKAPRTDQEWEDVGNAVAALIESGNLLMMGSRAVDQDDWVAMSQAMIEAGKAALKATEAKSVLQLLESGEAINASCNGCHRKYQRGS